MYSKLPSLDSHSAMQEAVDSKVEGTEVVVVAAAAAAAATSRAWHVSRAISSAQVMCASHRMQDAAAGRCVIFF